MYEEMITVADHFTSNVKKNMLDNTVSGIAELQQVKTQSAHDIENGKPPLTYEKYLVLLLSAASSYDTKRGLSKSRHTHNIHYSDQDEVDQREYFNDHNSRIVFNHDITYDTNTSYDIDTDLNYLQIHESNQRRNILRPSMAKAKRYNGISFLHNLRQSYLESVNHS